MLDEIVTAQGIYHKHKPKITQEMVRTTEYKETF